MATSTNQVPEKVDLAVQKQNRATVYAQFQFDEERNIFICYVCSRELKSRVVSNLRKHLSLHDKSCLTFSTTKSTSTTTSSASGKAKASAGKVRSVNSNKANKANINNGNSGLSDYYGDSTDEPGSYCGYTIGGYHGDSWNQYQHSEVGQEDDLMDDEADEEGMPDIPVTTMIVEDEESEAELYDNSQDDEESGSENREGQEANNVDNDDNEYIVRQLQIELACKRNQYQEMRSDLAFFRHKFDEQDRLNKRIHKFVLENFDHDLNQDDGGVGVANTSQFGPSNGNGNVMNVNSNSTNTGVHQQLQSAQQLSSSIPSNISIVPLGRQSPQKDILPALLLRPIAPPPSPPPLLLDKISSLMANFQNGITGNYGGSSDLAPFYVSSGLTITPVVAATGVIGTATAAAPANTDRNEENVTGGETGSNGDGSKDSGE